MQRDRLLLAEVIDAAERLVELTAERTPADFDADHRQEWSATVGQVYCSTVVRCSRLTELLTHHILVHTPHHVDTRIPFYRLETAYAELRVDYGRHIHEYRFQWSTVRAIFATCQGFDYDTTTWSRFSDIAADRGDAAA